MKKIISLVLGFALILAMTGCASMLKSMGGVTKDEFVAHEAAMDERLNTISAAWVGTETAMKEVESIKATVDKLSADVEAFSATAQELEAAKATIETLAVKVDTLSDETLLRLAQLIKDALAAESGQPESNQGEAK
jgi:uncharacterized protein YceK